MEISSYIFHVHSCQNSCVASLATVAMVAALLMLVDLVLEVGYKVALLLLRCEYIREFTRL